MKKITLLLLLGAFFLNSGNASKPSAFLRVGKDYALFFAVNDYVYWDDLANPVSDVEAIASDLKNLFGFETEVVRNPERKTIWDKIEAYRKKTYDKDAQLLIFFSGHGEFNEVTKQGFFVPKYGQKDDFDGDSYIEYEYLKRRISSLPCEHILLALDACYSGTALESIALKGGPGKRAGKNDEAERRQYILNSLQYKTRIMLTSGAKVRTPDKSQFVDKFLKALRSQGGEDRLLNSQELFGYLTTASPTPVISTFGEHEPGAEFLFVLEGSGTTPKPAEEKPDNTSSDLAAWQKADHQKTKAAYKQYSLDFCPGGAFCEAAEAKIKAISDKDIHSWLISKAADSIGAFEQYLMDFPTGEYRKQAENNIELLKSIVEFNSLKGSEFAIQIKNISLKSYKINKTRLFGSQRRISRGSKVDKLSFCFETQPNPFVVSGDEVFYIRIIEPTGEIMAIASIGSGVMEDKSLGSNIRYTTTAHCKYSGGKNEVCGTWQPGQKFYKGNYEFEIYNKGFLVGTSRIILK